VQTAPDGQVALSVLAALESRPPCLILVDMRMPRMDGWQFARVVKERYNRRPPIVVVTAAEEAAQRAADIGADGYVSKPFNLDDLLGAVARYCPAAC
jgi:CheY-like chemotaxis protein